MKYYTFNPYQSFWHKEAVSTDDTPKDSHEASIESVNHDM